MAVAFANRRNRQANRFAGQRFNSAHPINRKCVALISMDEGWSSNYSVLDHSPYRRSLTVTGTLNSTNPFAQDYQSWMRSFNGTDSIVTINSQAMPKGTEARSFSFWIYPRASTTAADNRLISNVNGAGSGTGYLFAIEDNAISIGIGGSRVITPASGLTLNEVYHIAVTFPQGGDNEDHIVYVNAQPQTLSLEAGSLGVAVNTNSGSDSDWVLGVNSDANGNYYDGGMGLFRCWTRQITSDEVTALYTKPHVGMAPSRARFFADSSPAFSPFYLSSILGGRVL